MAAFAAANIYNMVILPLFSYSSLLKPTLTQTQVNRILSFERRAKEIIKQRQCQKKQFNPLNIQKQRICSFMYKVIMAEAGDVFQNYFEFLNTTVNTRNKNIKLKLEYGSQVSKVSWSKNI